MIWTFFVLVIGLICWYLVVKTRDLWGSRNRTPAIRTFHKQIHGITHRNGDGSSRQKIIADCYEGEELVLVPEPTNRFDSGAVKICRKNGDQLGYWPADAQIADQLSNGWTFRVTIDEIYPFEEHRKNHGVRMRVDVLTMAHGKVPNRRYASRNSRLRLNWIRPGWPLRDAGNTQTSRNRNHGIMRRV